MEAEDPNGYMQNVSTRLTFTPSTGMPVVAKLDCKLNDHPNTNGDQTASSNLGHDLLQIGHVVGGANQRSSTPKEGVGTGSIHNGMLLSLLDGRARETDVVGVLLDRQ